MNANVTAQDDTDDWGDVWGALDELDWYASRKKNLADTLPTNPSKTFATMMTEEIEDLRVLLLKLRKSHG